MRAELQASEKRTLAAKASLQVADARVAQWREELSERLRCLRAAELAHNRSFFPMPLGASAPESELQLVPWREGLGVFLWAGCVSRARLDSIMVGGATVALYEETSTVAESLRTSGKCLDHWDMQRLLVLEGSPSATLEQRLRAWHPFEASGARVWMMRIGCSSAVVGLKAAWMLLEDEHAHPLVLQVDGTISSATWDKLRHWQYRLYRCGTGEEGSTGTNCIFYKSRADHSVVLPPADAERRSAYANQLAQEVLNYFGTRTAAEKDGNTPHVVGAFDAARKQLFASAMSVLGKSQQ